MLAAVRFLSLCPISSREESTWWRGRGLRAKDPEGYWGVGVGVGVGLGELGLCLVDENKDAASKRLGSQEAGVSGIGYRVWGLSRVEN